jgi:RNA polymerase sigma factor for flagellar operon FliA
MITTARLDEDKVRELWGRYKHHGDQAARDRLILSYAPLVKYVAGRMSNGLPAHIEEADLISYGLLGLISALKRFDPDRQIKFETYAISRIKGSIIDELRALDWVPRSVRSKARDIERVCALLENRLHRAPTDDEIADELHVSVIEFRHSLTQISTTSIVALDELWPVPGSDGGQSALIDTIEDPRSDDPARMLDLSEIRMRLAAAIDALPKREKTVIALYYYENLTLREIGEVLGVTESRVSQLHTKAILRLKGRLRDEIEPAAIM